MRWAVILSLLLFLSSCDFHCIYPGDGVSANFSTISVPPYLEGMNSSNPGTLWVDSGITIREGEEVSMTLSGEVDLCGKLSTKENLEECPWFNCAVLEVGNRFCANNRYSPGIYDPSSLLNPSNRDPLCKNNLFSSAPYYVNTYLNVLPGERVLFEVIPPSRPDIIDCNKPRRGFSWYNKKDLTNASGEVMKMENGETADPLDICQAGGKIVVERGKTETERIIVAIPASEKFLNSSLVTNGYTPRSNRVIVGNESSRWINGAEVDMRLVVPSILSDAEFCKVAFYKHVGIENKKKISCEYKYKDACHSRDKNHEITRFDTHKINSMCNNFNLGGQRYRSGFYSVRYDEDFTEADPCFRARIKNNIGADKAWADLLVAKIGNPESSRSVLTTEEDEAQRCIYNIGKDQTRFSAEIKRCMDIKAYGNFVPSLELNEWLTIPDDVIPGSPLFLGIAGAEDSSSRKIYSGYRVRVRKNCSYENGKNLYIYIGEKRPSQPPGANIPNMHELDFGNSSNKKLVINPRDVDKGTYSISFSGKGRVYFGIAGAADSTLTASAQIGEYLPSEDNRYVVSVVQERWYPNFSGPFNVVYHAIVKLFYGKNEMDLFGKPTSSGVIVQIYSIIVKKVAPVVQAFIVLYLVTYGLSFLLGMIRDPRSDVVLRVAKIAFILLLVSDYSWQFFGETIFDMFVNSSNEVIHYFTGNISGQSSLNNPFEFLDRTVGIVITNQFWLRMLALFLSGPVGWLVMTLILWGVFLFFSCIIEGMIIYLMILIATGLLFLLAPIFIAFLLFQRTKPLFEGWLKMLISFALRPIFIFSTLALLNAIMMATLYPINNFGVCPGCAISTDIFGSELCFLSTLIPVGFDSGMNSIDRFLIPGVGDSNFMGLPVSLVSVIIFLIVAHSMKSFLKITDSMVDMITSTMMGYTGSTGGGSPSDAGHSAYQSMLSVVGMDDQTQSEIQHARKSRSRSRRLVTLELADGDAKPSSGDIGSKLLTEKQGVHSALTAVNPGESQGVHGTLTAVNPGESQGVHGTLTAVDQRNVTGGDNSPYEQRALQGSDSLSGRSVSDQVGRIENPLHESSERENDRLGGQGGEDRGGSEVKDEENISSEIVRRSPSGNPYSSARRSVSDQKGTIENPLSESSERENYRPGGEGNERRADSEVRDEENISSEIGEFASENPYSVAGADPITEEQSLEHPSHESPDREDSTRVNEEGEMSEDDENEDR